jgi:hypothetical protein
VGADIVMESLAQACDFPSPVLWLMNVLGIFRQLLLAGMKFLRGTLDSRIARGRQFGGPMTSVARIVRQMLMR